MIGKLVIFEGPDGGGKTSTAELFAHNEGYRYIHHGPYKGLSGKQLSMKYIESMMAAMNGYNVVLDRCWLSEIPYGIAYRNGENRINDADTQYLWAFARRLKMRLIVCLPPWEKVMSNFMARRDDEYLEDLMQLDTVYKWYEEFIRHSTPPEIKRFDPFRWTTPEAAALEMKWFVR